MPLFEYATLRVVPRIEREEFLNVGVVLLCRAQNFLAVRFVLSEVRLQAFLEPGLDMSELSERLQAFEQMCQGRPLGGAIGRLPLAERFRWLTAARSTVLQTSPVHPGICTEASEALARLFEQLVM